jgi:formylglycine-generating enzyme required for sulfatase activity
LWARPAHEVNVDSFCLDVHEVSVEEYTRCVDAGKCVPAHLIATFQSDGLEGTGSKQSEALHSEQCNAGKPGRERHPINCVSHFQAVQHCAFRGARLATEAEWEFAARGDSNRPFPWGNGQPTADHINACGKECERWHQKVGLSSEMHGLMYQEDDGYSGTAPVGSFPLGATSDGVEDLIGNVFEWTSGGLYPFDRRPLHNPRGPTESESYVIRGGNFNSGIPEFSDPALRFAMLAESYSHGVGLRCADDPKFKATPAQPDLNAPAPALPPLDLPGG